MRLFRRLPSLLAATMLLTNSIPSVAAPGKPFLSGIISAKLMGLFVAVNMLLVTETTTVSAQREIAMDWFVPTGDSFPPMIVNVGDTLVFYWEGFHNVYIHPTGDCTQTGRSAVGFMSGTVYTFAEEDVGELEFACDVGNHCENGMRVTVTVVSVDNQLTISPSVAPSVLSNNNPTTIEMAWFVPPSGSFPPMTVNVGDTIVFNWGGFHNVYIHPTGDCTETDRIQVGVTSGASYTFTEADVGDLEFACDIASHCELGMRVTVTVISTVVAPLTISPSVAPSGPSINNPNTIELDWFIPPGDSFPPGTVNVGDTLVFNWGGFHNVYIHPTGDCTETDRIEVGTASGASYTFTEADVGDLEFVCDVGTHCENGMRITITVVSTVNTPLTVSPSAATTSPSGALDGAPSIAPTLTSSAIPSGLVATVPSEGPSSVPSTTPTQDPTSDPILVPTSAPTLGEATADPTNNPTAFVPSAVPSTPHPTAIATPRASAVPTAISSQLPSTVLSTAPSAVMTGSEVPSIMPTLHPTSDPVLAPTSAPTSTGEPTAARSINPSNIPTVNPLTLEPTADATANASFVPTVIPSQPPSTVLSTAPSAAMTPTRSEVPSSIPTLGPTSDPVLAPTSAPTLTGEPTAARTINPSNIPTVNPPLTLEPTADATANASFLPSAPPSSSPTEVATLNPSQRPTAQATPGPSLSPSFLRQTTNPTGADLPDTLIVTYSVVWTQFRNNCRGYDVRLEFSCSEGGTLDFLRFDNRLGRVRRRLSESNVASVDIEAETSSGRSNGLIVDATVYFTCSGDTQGSVQSEVRSVEQTLSCRTSENVGSHSLNLAYYDHVAGTFIRDSSCSNGLPNSEGSCVEEGQCTATRRRCFAILNELIAQQNLPLPTSAFERPGESPSRSPTRRGGGDRGGRGCFSGVSTVMVEGNGKVPLEHVRIGDRVLTANEKYESVYSFGHRHQSLQLEFLRIATTSVGGDMPIEISANHMIYVVRKDGVDRMLPASMVQIGDVLMSGPPEHPCHVVRIDRVVREGVFAPFTESGTIVVNGLLASTFVAFSESHELGLGVSYQWLARTFEAPHRWYCGVFDCSNETYHEETGISNWVYDAWTAANWIVSLKHDGNPLCAFFFGVTFIVMMICLLVVGVVDEGMLVLVVLALSYLLHRWLASRK